MGKQTMVHPDNNILSRVKKKKKKNYQTPKDLKNLKYILISEKKTT